MENYPNNYSNRELDLKFSMVMDKLEVIHQQTLKTNGRVNTLEKDTDSLQVWQGYMKGGIAIIAMVLLPMFFVFAKQLVDK